MRDKAIKGSSTRTCMPHFVADAPLHRRNEPFLSSADNVPFGDTLRAKGYSYFYRILLYSFS